MPCRYDPSPAEIEAANNARDEKLIKPFRKKLDRLTHENDMLREIVIAWRDGNGISDKLEEFVDTLEDTQIAHRKEDLARLRETFKQSGDFERFEKVVLADPERPLEDQLGFDPDEF